MTVARSAPFLKSFAEEDQDGRSNEGRGKRIMNTTTNMTGGNTANGARVLSVLLGIWLFISAFVWPHSREQMTNTWILGVLAVIFALVATFVESRARYLNTLLSIWLFISAFALPRVTIGTTWNNAIVAIVLFLCSLVPGEVARRRRLVERPAV